MDYLLVERVRGTNREELCGGPERQFNQHAKTIKKNLG